MGQKPVAVFISEENDMFDIQTQLFEGKDVRFGPIDHEKDAEIESKWTHDSDFMRMYDFEPARPMSVAMVKKKYEKLEKEIEEEKNMYYFTIRSREDDRLIGKALVHRIEWSNGNAWIRLGIGSKDDQRKGYGSQALQMLLRFMFAELNLYRVAAPVQEYNEAGIALLKKFGFTEEVRRRQALDRDGRRWDLLVFGLLQDEWVNQAGA
ncbi:MAG: GNAT family N-acetyltransferase [Anaerolineales bacterium]|nr:MAG: GNAT family N-acetyltransferase [Anaerolineales bacterium]